MIENLEIKIDSDLYHSNTKELIGKINEIIDFLNGTFLMQEPDTVTIPLEDCTFLTGLCTEETLNIKGTPATLLMCPHCGESYYMKLYSTCTAVNYPEIYKDGVNINKDRNTHTTHYQCLICNKEFTI